MANDYKKIATEIVATVGKDNIVNVLHCATRLRLIVKDESIIDTAKVEEIDLVKGVFFNAGQYQIILGTGIVNKVYEEVAKGGFAEISKEEAKQANAKNGNPAQQFVRKLGDIFVPIIPGIVATGMALGLKGLIMNPDFLALLGYSPDHIPLALSTFIEIISVTIFAFLPVFVSWSTFKVSGGSPVLGILLGLMLVYPALPSAWLVVLPVTDPAHVDPIEVFGFIPWVGYQGSIIPVLIAAYTGAKVEQFFTRIIPNVLSLIAVPFLTLVVSLLLALCIIGPIFHNVEIGLMHAVTMALHIPFGLGGFAIGFIWMFAVITGAHHIMNLIEFNLLATTHFNPMNAIITASIAAQGAAALAMGFRSRNKKAMALAWPSAISAWLGITEPAMFGMTLRFGFRPFVIACLVGGFGGMFAIWFNLEASGNGVTVIPGMLLYIYSSSQLLGYMSLFIAAIIATFILVYLFGTPKEMLEKYPSDK